jgi:cardiolipin synthase
VWAAWYYPANLVTEVRIATIPLILVLIALQRYGAALVLFVAAACSDGVDGWLARHFDQHTRLGAYLDPVADKGLLVALFLMLAIEGRMPWPLTIVVFVRDGCILFSALALYLLTPFRDFRPTWWGKASTTAELATVAVALLEVVDSSAWVRWLERFGWVAVTVLVVVSGIHYSFTSARRYMAAMSAHP